MGARLADHAVLLVPRLAEQGTTTTKVVLKMLLLKNCNKIVTRLQLNMGSNMLNTKPDKLITVKVFLLLSLIKQVQE